MPTGSTRRLAVIIAAAALLGACTGGDATPSATAAGSSSGAPALSPAPSPTAAAPASSPTVPPDPLEVYRAIAADVVEIRGLAAPERTDPQVIDAETLRKNLEAEFDESNPEAQIQIAERVYKALGLLPEGASLRDIYLELQGSQVIGYYDPSADELFIVSRSGSLGPTERLTYAHEFTHELQDRRFDLESLGLEGVTDEGDRGLAVLGLVEGDAVTVQGAWMTTNLSPAELAQVAAEAGDPEMLAVLARTPAILLETSLFPYQAGATFIATLLARGGYAAVDAAYGNPPASTEQVIHPEKYRSTWGCRRTSLDGSARAGPWMPRIPSASSSSGYGSGKADSQGMLPGRPSKDGAATGWRSSRRRAGPVTASSS
ncbi:MAG: hypothetical protein K2Q20_09995 [Phycisphaerales bacterium]|nr:hypothetical protein [Phycisphaerales bacterium]